ncbi:hypothetical protein ACQ4PT_062814 [Festuca glaucescens]
MAPPPPPALAIPAPITPAPVAFELVRNLKFDDVRIEHTYQNMWNVCAKVQWKGQVKESAHGHSYLQCILLDENGSKMEALAYNNLADRFNEMLHAGLTYNFIGVGFCPIEMYSEHFLYIDSEFIMGLKSRTEVRTLGRRIDSSLCPPRFPQFNTIFMRRDKSITGKRWVPNSFLLNSSYTNQLFILILTTLADVVGVLAYVGERQYKYKTPYYRGIPARDIGLMNFQGQLILLHVYSQHLYRNIGRWAPAQREFQTLAVTNVQIDKILGSLSTMDESSFIFSPRTNLEDHHFEAHNRLTAMMNGLAFVTAHAVTQMYNFIMEVDDQDALNTIWIRSPLPYMIEITLGMIQQSIRAGGRVHPDCFNLAVRGLSCAEVERHVRSKHLGWKHLFDLQLQAQAQALRRSPISQVNRTTTLIDAMIPTLPPYNIFDSEVYLLPLAVMDAYALLVVNMQRRRTFLMDLCYCPNRQEALIQQSEVMKVSKALMEEFNEMHRTMNVGWDTQVAEWPMDSYQVMGTNRNSDDSGFTVLEHMATADGTERFDARIPNDPLELRKKLMSRMEPKVQSESVRMLSFLESSDTCRSRAKRYADAVASIARLGHPYISLCFTEDAKPVKLGSSSMKQTLHAEMLADFMWEIERAQLEYASCAGKGPALPPSHE